MNEEKKSNGNGCVTIALITFVVAMGLAMGFVGGVMMEGEQRAVVVYPDIPAPPPAQLNFVPSAQVFAEPGGDCPDPSLPFAGWEDGVGGVLPPCWTREEQNAYMRSH